MRQKCYLANMDASPDSLRLSFEVALGILAITTFLVGFSTVRLQASLQEWRERGERVVDRLLDQNNNDDLLPLPSTLHTITGSSKSLNIDFITWLSLIATVVSAGLFIIVLGELQNQATSTESTLITWLFGLAFIIVIAGLCDIMVVKYKARKESRQTPARVFARLETSLLAWSRGAEQNYFTSGRIAKHCSEFEEMIPDWCWMRLIRYDLQRFHDESPDSNSRTAFSSDGRDVVVLPTWFVRLGTFQFRSEKQSLNQGFNPVLLRPAVERIQRLAKDDLDDWYSLIAFVWTSALLERSSAASISESHRITIEQLRKIAAFRKETGDALAELALRCVQRVAISSGQFTSELAGLYESFELPNHVKVHWRNRMWQHLLERVRPVTPLRNREH